MQNPVNSGVVNTSQRGIQRNIKHRRKTLHGRCPRLRVTTENIWCDLSVFRFLPVTMFRALYGYIHLNSIESLVRSDMIEHHIIAGEHVQKAYLNRRSQQMAVLNACLALKGASYVVLLALTHGLVKHAQRWGKMSGHDSVHHAPYCTTGMTLCV